MKTFHHSCRGCPYVFTTLEDVYDTGEEDYYNWCIFAPSPNYGHMVIKCEVKGCDLDLEAEYFYEKYRERS